MLARLVRTSSVHLARQVTSRATPRCCKHFLGCPSFLAYCGQPACSVKTVAAAEASEAWPQDLKARLIQSAAKIRFHHQIDDNKGHTDSALDEAEEAIGYRFQSRQLLRLAFTHSSATPQNNVPLAWVGDSVLQLVVSEGLLSRYSTASIGDLAALRSAMIGRASCFVYAQHLMLQKWLLVGNGIESTCSKEISARPRPPISPNMLSELFEAVLGAIYVDADLEQAHIWFAKHVDWPATYEDALKRFGRNR